MGILLFYFIVYSINYSILIYLATESCINLDFYFAAPNPQSLHGDCSRPSHVAKNSQYFCSRGHLTPKGAFDTQDERDLTFIMTNVAPQWQQFNGENWRKVEEAVKEYVQAVGHEVYVFTGTGKFTS